MSIPESSCSFESAMQVVSIFKHDPAWKETFARESEAIRAIATRENFFIDHVGSTAVNDLPSKPIIDMLVSVHHWSTVEKLLEELKKIGYRMKEYDKEASRYFLTKYQSANLGCFHIHICRPNDRWGQDMLVFRDELAADQGLVKEYAELKQTLARAHCDDLGKYTHEKTFFIKSVLHKVERSFSVDHLLTHQRSELDEAQRIQIKMIFTQLAVAWVAACSVFLVGNKYLLHAAGAGLLLMLLWVHYSQRQQRHRSAGDQARRAVLLISGLDKVPPAGQKLRIIDGFEVSTLGRPRAREEDHFASREPPGYKRLSELIEESAYWTRDLQRFSAKIMAIIFTVLMLFIVCACGVAISSLTSETLIDLSRALVAVVVFLISSDILGLLLAYRNSATTIDEIFKRVESVAARKYTESDVLLLMVDYNAAIEKAPAVLPGVFKLRNKTLSQHWRAYISTKQTNTEI